jgi:hypothetical protein
MVNVPGQISAHEIATGLLIRGIKIKGMYGEHYTIVSECSISPVQDVDEIYLIQGGPRSAIGNIGNKHVEGTITLPLRVDKDGIIDPFVKELLDNAQNPDYELTIQTNHILADLNITANDGGTDNNQLLDIDCCIVSDLTLKVSPTEGVNITAKIMGMYDGRNESELISPPDEFLLHRQLSFADCDISRLESDMRTISNFELKIQNEVQMPVFLMTLTETPHDQPGLVGVSSCKWTGSFEEILRRGVETETYIHGGFMVGENLEFNFGELRAIIKVPMFKIAEQPINYSYLTRRTEFFAQISPEMRNLAGDLFIFP